MASADMTAKMRPLSEFPEDRRGAVTGLLCDIDDTLTSGGRVTTVCTARVALPSHEGDNPWKRHGDDWKPRAAA